jgi:diaminopimelate decarboxylase
VFPPEPALTDARHAALRHWPVRDDCLQVGGLSLTRLAERVGRTPFYAYDRGLIIDRIAHVRQHLPAGVDLHYAVKANPMPAVLHHIVARVDGLDVASAGELRSALDAGANPGDISFAGPGKQAFELRQAIAAGVLINLESRREAELAAALSAQLRLPARVAVRVNPDFELKSSGMKMGGGAKQFGVDAEEVPALLEEIDRLGLAFEGFHIFSGSQNLRADAIVDAQEKAVELAVRLAGGARAKPRVVNIGGGFGIPYFPGERALDLAPIGARLAQLAAVVARELPGARLVVELGRYLVGEAGLYVCRVVDRKTSRGQVFLVTDGGLHHHLAASGNFGQVLRKNFPAVIGNKVEGAVREVASVVGPLCTPLDLLVDRMALAAAEPGDLVAVFQSGAYGATASPQAFLSHPPVVETLV